VTAGAVLLGLTIVWAQWWILGEVSSTIGRASEEKNLREIGVACQNFHATHGAFPHSVAHLTSRGTAGLSWRVALLPYIEHELLYMDFRCDEPWDSPHNKALLSKMPKLYLRPNQHASPDGLTHYLAVTGKGSVWGKNPPTVSKGMVPRGRRHWGTPGEMQLGLGTLAIKDGPSNTALVVVAEKGVPWTKPDDFDYTDGPIGPRLKSEFGGTSILFADGRVKFLTDAPETTLRTYMTANGGEAIED
jgi:hypothetical protein